MAATVTDVTTTEGRARKVTAFKLSGFLDAAETVEIEHKLGRRPAYVSIQAMPGVGDAAFDASIGAFGVTDRTDTKVKIRKKATTAAGAGDLILVQVFREFPLSIFEAVILDQAVPSATPPPMLPPWFGMGG